MILNMFYYDKVIFMYSKHEFDTLLVYITAYQDSWIFKLILFSDLLILNLHNNITISTSISNGRIYVYITYYSSHYFVIYMLIKNNKISREYKLIYVHGLKLIDMVKENSINIKITLNIPRFIFWLIMFRIVEYIYMYLYTLLKVIKQIVSRWLILIRLPQFSQSKFMLMNINKK